MAADCHIHMLFDGVDWKAALARHAVGPEPGFIRKTLETYEKLGYTYLRDGGDRWGVGAMARVLAPEYGITYRTPLAPLCLEGHYGAFIGLTYRNLQEYTLLVRQQKAQGADFIKIMISGIMDFNRYGVLTEPPLEPALIRQLVYIAHSEGMAVMAHANGSEPVIAAAEMGVDSVEHGAYLNREALAAMAQYGTVWVPTLSTVGNLLGKGRHPDNQVGRILESALENLAWFKDRGFVAAGTDAGAWAVPHGVPTEAPLLAQAGITQTHLIDGLTIIRRKFG